MLKNQLYLAVLTKASITGCESSVPSCFIAHLLIKIAYDDNNAIQVRCLVRLPEVLPFATRSSIIYTSVNLFVEGVEKVISRHLNLHLSKKKKFKFLYIYYSAVLLLGPDSLAPAG